MGCRSRTLHFALSRKVLEWSIRFRLDFRRLPGPVFDPPQRGWVRARFPEQRLVIEPILGLVPPTNIQRYNVNNKVATLTKCIFLHPPTSFYCMQNFSGGLNYLFPALRNFHRESLLITISPNKCQMRVLTHTKLRYCSIVYTFYGSSRHQFFIFDFVFCTRYPCYSDLLLTCVSETVHKE